MDNSNISESVHLHQIGYHVSARLRVVLRVMTITSSWGIIMIRHKKKNSLLAFLLFSSAACYQKLDVRTI
jgi:hypothetical protein